MDWFLVFILVAVGLLIPTAYAGFIGAPYAPTRLAAVKKAFDSINLSSTDVLVDLGAGDGKILLEASRRGAEAHGYELSPIMWFVSWVRTLGRKKIKLHYGNFYKASLQDATVVFAFLMPHNMSRVVEFLRTQTFKTGRYFIAYAFPIPDYVAQTVIKEKDCLPIYIYDLQKLTAKNEDRTV